MMFLDFLARIANVKAVGLAAVSLDPRSDSGSHLTLLGHYLSILHLAFVKIWLKLLMKQSFRSLWSCRKTSIVSVALLLGCSVALPAQAQLLTGFKSTDVVTTYTDDLWKPSDETPNKEAEDVTDSSVEIFLENLYESDQQTPEQKGDSNTQVAQAVQVQANPVLTTPRLTVPSAHVQNHQPVLIQAPSPLSQNTDASPVDLQADDLVHNEQTQIITASGNVILLQAGRELRAERVSYNLKTDEVFAEGNVVLTELNGDQHFANEVQLNEKLKNGFVKGLKSFLSDGSRFIADEGQRQDGNTTIMEDAIYTACKACEGDPDKAPIWQIKAGKVIHDQEAHRISYRNARFEVLGVPVAYTPYFSHPDGTVKQESGFLIPSFGFRTELGAFLGTEYYIAIDETQDATVGVVAFSDEDPLGTAEYRKRWDNASLQLEGSVTSSDRKDSEAGVKVTKSSEVRGHIFGEGLWDINEKWRAGLDVAWASDDQFLRQYDIDGEDVLQNKLYVERFSGRHYAQANLQTFQDLRVAEQQIDQPEVLPEIEASFISEPGAVPVVGGRWLAEGSFLGLRRSGRDQDMNRLSGELGWQRRMVSDYGLLTTIDASARSDFFSVRDRDLAVQDPTLDSDETAARFFPQVHVQSSYPVVKNFSKTQINIEPTIALTIAPDINDRNDDIPNEDSQDVQLDTTNLFEPNRFSGKDLVEDRSRVTYGLRTGLYDHEGNQIEAFLGQSIRFNKDNNPFPAGSGLDVQESDIVGQVSFDYENPNDDRNTYGFDYIFQLDGRTLNSERHEVDAFANWNRLSLSANYLFATALDGTDILEGRDQLNSNASLYLNKNWRANIGGVQDFGENDGLRKAYVGLDYLGQCLFLSLTGVRNLTDDISGDSSTDILFRIGLKNLGEFPETPFHVDPCDN